MSLDIGALPRFGPHFEWKTTSFYKEASMLFEAALEYDAPTNLIAHRLEPLSFDLSRIRPPKKVAQASAREIQAVRQALAEGLDPPQQVIDHVVERILKELTW
jgi:hypothetical protein